MAIRKSSSSPRHEPRPSARRRARRRNPAATQSSAEHYAEFSHEHEMHQEPPMRRSRRKRSPLWKRLRVVVGVLALLGLCELAVASLSSPKANVKAVTIGALTTTPTGEVEAVIQPLVGQNWVRANRGPIEKQLLALPTVKAVHITRVLAWPPRMQVQIEERNAFARVGSGKNWWVADENGVVFRPANTDDGKLFAITSPQLSPVIGKSVPDATWQKISHVVRALNENPSWSLRRVYFDKQGYASLRVTGGWNDETLVRLGADKWEQKLERAQLVLGYFETSRKKARVLNLVSFDMPQWTPRTADVSPPAQPAPSDKPTGDDLGQVQEERNARAT